ncbi:hypothetical protein NT239_00160 [Chitinibacter sp. SCUT-21]|uniref:hypothetical protein n=1 Tax=Chitinibacter sp. SCUT-21 TaxID=2970891 RepID=UPI0035A68E82
MTKSIPSVLEVSAQIETAKQYLRFSLPLSLLINPSLGLAIIAIYRLKTRAWFSASATMFVAAFFALISYGALKLWWPYWWGMVVLNLFGTLFVTYLRNAILLGEQHFTEWTPARMVVGGVFVFLLLAFLSINALWLMRN